MFSSRDCTLARSASTLRCPLAEKKVSTIRSRCRVALSPRSAIQRDKRSRAAVVGEAGSALRPRLLWLETRWVMIGAGGWRTELRLILNLVNARILRRIPASSEGRPKAATLCPSRRSGAPLRLLLPRLIGARFRAECDRQPVPSVDRHRDH